jgi:hypothetical protein
MTLLEGRYVLQEAEMALKRGSFGGYEFDRMVVLFSMVDGQREVPVLSAHLQWTT